MAMEGAESEYNGSTEDQEKQLPSSPPKSPPATDHEEKTTHIKFLLSNAEAGSVIGKGGSTINDFQSQSGARIQLSRNFEFFPGTSDRVVMVSGTIDDVLKAVDLILSKLLDEFYVEEGGDVDPHFKVRLVVPSGSCGGIIGKGGSIIKSLIEESGAGIKISPLDSTFPGLYERLVSVNGTLGDQMRAIELILLKLTEDSHYLQAATTPFQYAVPIIAYNGMNYRPNVVAGKFQNSRPQNKDERSNSVTIGIADEHIGLVVGRGGRNVMEISQMSGAKIRISERGDFMSGTTDRKVTITGTQRSISAAEAIISRKLSSVSER